MKKGKELQGSLYVIFAAMLWGIIGIFTRHLTQYGIESIRDTFLRNFIAAAGMTILILLKDRSLFRIRPKDLWMFLGNGICSIVFFNICYFKAIELTTMSLAAVLLYTAPCFVMLLSAACFHEKITKVKLIALVLSFTGCILCCGLFGSKLRLPLQGLLLGIGAGLGYALYSIFGTFALKRYDTFTITFYTFLIAALSLLPSAGAGTFHALTSGGLPAWSWGLLFGIVSTLCPFILYTKGLQRLEAGKASILAFVEPLMATLCGFLVYHETLSLSSIIGILLIFGSVLLLNARKDKAARDAA